MKKALLGLFLVLVIGGLAWAYLRFFYVPPVDKAFLSAVAAARLGDEQAFLSAFTDKSRPVIAGLLGLARGRDPRTTRSHPFYFLVTERIEGVEVEPSGTVAWLTLRRDSDQSTKSSYDLRLVLEERVWRIDAFSFTGQRRVVDRAR